MPGKIEEKAETTKLLEKLNRLPEKINPIYAIAETLYDRNFNERLNLTDIDEIERYLSKTETALELMKIQYKDLINVEPGYTEKTVPAGF